ncbi:amidohydrolase [Putridiphycobacter roseus]|uniref:Amidohydrolase n=1 Tax=Putridiphycobacter roseus TaxID=2219161 RepID=A0A2W1N2W8_9FLAO|nr:M20 family metallopeptidase [Putridiphycobacter roseus]PZE17341.1 amidohydrolase [Putridiphycobacter roseus]
MKKEIIQKQLNDLHQEVITIREHIHKNPELSFEEYETSKFIQSKLAEFGIHFQVIGKTGITGTIQPKGAVKKWIALRADIDALPILEETNAPYQSTKKGVMHACGHDVHTAMLLGTLKFIQQNIDSLEVGVKFIFQPGEEKLPGGASMLIAEGVLENPKVDEIYALHVFPELEAGAVGLKGGMYMASCDEIYMTIHGKGGHGAMPHQNIDPILITAHIITGLQQVISRNCNPAIPAVLSFGKIEGLGATNIIPNKVELAGTFRTMNEEWRAEAHHLIKKQATFIANGMGAKIDVNIVKGYPFLKNDEALTELTKQKLVKYFGENAVIDLPIRMTGEDFAFYGQQIPSTFIRIGTKNEKKGIVYPVHHSKFDIDSNALVVGMETFINIVFQKI